MGGETFTGSEAPGGIACGKSSVLAMLSALGARTIDADRVTHRLQLAGSPVYRQIVATFGNAILTGNGDTIDRRKLGTLVFNDSQALRRLEAIVHPAVHSELRAWLKGIARESGHGSRMQPLARPVAVIDAVKLLESGWRVDCQQVWIVTCPTEQQIVRMVTTRSMSEQEARQRILAQPSQESRLTAADVVIDNGGTIEQTRSQVEAAWQRVRASL